MFRKVLDFGFVQDLVLEIWDLLFPVRLLPEHSWR